MPRGSAGWGSRTATTTAGVRSPAERAARSSSLGSSSARPEGPPHERLRVDRFRLLRKSRTRVSTRPFAGRRGFRGSSRRRIVSPLLAGERIHVVDVKLQQITSAFRSEESDPIPTDVLAPVSPPGGPACGRGGAPSSPGLAAARAGSPSRRARAAGPALRGPMGLRARRGLRSRAAPRSGVARARRAGRRASPRGLQRLQEGDQLGFAFVRQARERVSSRGALPVVVCDRLFE